MVTLLHLQARADGGLCPVGQRGFGPKLVKLFEVKHFKPTADVDGLLLNVRLATSSPGLQHQLWEDKEAV